MLADTTETVAEKQRKAATINQLACPSYSCSGASGTDVLTRMNEGSGKPSAVIKALKYIGPHSGFEPGRRIKNHKRWPLHYTAHSDYTDHNSANESQLTYSGKWPHMHKYNCCSLDQLKNLYMLYKVS